MIQVQTELMVADNTGAKKIGMDIMLKKNIPIGAGLGGGSSNVAVTLMALNKIYNSNLRHYQLKVIGNKIGKDVAFFLSQKKFRNTRYRGRNGGSI